jgi:hypothetical protein
VTYWRPTSARSRHSRPRSGVEPTTALRAVFIWSWLHGFVSLEIAGNFASMGIDPGEIFRLQLAALAS